MASAHRPVWAVTPTYNEAENLPELAERILALAEPPVLLVVDDNSPDGTGRIADRLAAEHPGRFFSLHRPAKMGFASAYLLGMQYALDHGARVVINMDADLSHDPAVIPTMLARLDEADVALGSRYVPGGGTLNWGRERLLLSRTAGALIRLFSGLRVADPTSGFRAYSADILQRAKFREVRQEGYAFLSEMLFRCMRAGGRIVEVPITFEDRRAGSSKLSRRIILEAGLSLFSFGWRRLIGWRP
ncbi:MAG: polyprenol monophosphomannose synthase [Armatimonadota bacterium]